MTYIPDLSPCRYFDRPNPEMPLTPTLIAVGWLDAVHPFPTGDPGIEVVRKLQHIWNSAWIVTLIHGGHVCELCGDPKATTRGNLFVPGDGITYAAPTGILHYITRHGYLPPQEFCEAVLRSPLPNTPEFFARLQAVGWPSEFTAMEEVPNHTSEADLENPPFLPGRPLARLRKRRENRAKEGR